ncbi:MAG: hypothetical protein GY814_10605 [Gammaproteobacteria bacterium]|nr:hypothetical protein [Gammaproteobacteria bacterium]
MEHRRTRVDRVVEDVSSTRESVCCEHYSTSSADGMPAATADVVPRIANASHPQIPSADCIRDVTSETAYVRSIRDAGRLQRYRSATLLTSCAEHILVCGAATTLVMT